MFSYTDKKKNLIIKYNRQGKQMETNAQCNEYHKVNALQPQSRDRDRILQRQKFIRYRELAPCDCGAFNPAQLIFLKEDTTVIKIDAFLYLLKK